jgi:endonuclease YncB( thermonuclease family)
MALLRPTLILLLILLFSPAAAAPVLGNARVVDGDTLRIGPVDIRLFGIDAPERAQTCERDGRAWNCGSLAAETLRRLVSGREVQCEGRETDRYGRLIAVCTAGGVELNASLVRQGAALAYRRYSSAYVAEERAAREAGLGVWAGTVQSPEEFRRTVETSATDDRTCRIKGNISASGRIYHRPGQKYYAATQVNTQAGERWFCSAEEAEAAGWRAARR